MINFVKPEDLSQQFKTFSSNLALTEGQYSIDVPNYLADMEWNHMDKLHRPSIHNTYEEAIRIAFGTNFAISLTRWRGWPLFITVTDIRIQPGLYYQCMTLAGLVYVHFVISMKEENEMVHAKIEWYILSHKWLKFAHKHLSRKFYKLNDRLQHEDSQIRKQRFKLRKQGYTFGSEPVNYYSSNNLKPNTIYPPLPQEASINIDNLPFDIITEHSLGNIDFLVKRDPMSGYLLWPAVCPHEGGNLIDGKQCKKNQIQCPWHGLK